MNISFHPLYRGVAGELREFLKSEGINQDVNYVIGGDGALVLYKSLSQPNLLISPDSSKGYYKSCRFDNYKEFIKGYIKDSSVYHQCLSSVNVAVNDVVLPGCAINEVLIAEGLHKVTKMSLSFNGSVFRDSSNSGLIVYTSDGLNGWSPKLDARSYGSDLGVAAVLPLRNDLLSDSSVRLEGKLRVRFLDRNRATHLRLFIDCVDADPYDASCTDRRDVCFKPYDLGVNDSVTVWKGAPLVIVKKR